MIVHDLDVFRARVRPVEAYAAFIGSLPLAAKHFLPDYPADRLELGDVLFASNPAIGTEHLSDGVMIAPVYRRGRLVA